jgi:hypothetical protein
MIGTPVECSLWLVEYRHDNPDPKREPPFVHCPSVLIVSADPTGADVHEVARRVAEETTGQGKPVTGFVCEFQQRKAVNVRGLANLTAPSEMAPWVGSTNAHAVVDMANEISDLRRELASLQHITKVQAAELRRLHAEPGELPELDTQPAAPATEPGE